MNQIKLLNESVSNKIAAGEVVERPLSIVKELVENAIDAGSSAISIDITNGGIKEVCVTDNGSGIPAGDVSLAFEKHATSKIETVKDLDYISTQGFRGEALASIAAVSIADMKTKTRGDELGTHIRISGGRPDFAKPAGLPEGTSVCISNLFYNVPARLKFLKKPAQEAAYITDIVSRYILAFPEISFHYKVKAKRYFTAPGSGDLKAAIYCVYGGAILENIVFVSYMLGDIKVEGYASRPGTVMKNRRAGSVFVNRRYVRSTLIHDMVRSAYGQTLVKGEFPFFVINITVPVSAVDVNVHPNKLQVRFRDSAAVEHVINEAVSLACREVRGKLQLNVPKEEVASKNTVEMRAPQGFAQQELFSGFSPSMLEEQPRAPLEPANSYRIDDEGIDNSVNASIPEAAQEATPKLDYMPSFRLIGSFAKAYVLVEQGDNLLMIDQHAAHERILYDKFISTNTVASQSLLAPLVVTLSHEQKNLVDEHIDEFTSLGFDISPFGALEYKIAAVPYVFYDANPTELLNEALYEIAQNKGSAVLKRERIIRASCRSAVKAGDALSARELETIVQQFLRTDAVPTCPHGRPIISVISIKQIEKSFKRVL